MAEFGRRDGLRCHCRKAWGFESPFGYQLHGNIKPKWRNLVDAVVLGAIVARCEGSSPSLGTIKEPSDADDH